MSSDIKLFIQVCFYQKKKELFYLPEKKTKSENNQKKKKKKWSSHCCALISIRLTSDKEGHLLVAQFRKKLLFLFLSLSSLSGGGCVAAVSISDEIFSATD